MGFNSLRFIFFFIVVYVLYLIFRRSYRLQNILLLLASYVFYAAWDVRFLSLLAISTTVDFFVARKIPTRSTPRGKRQLLLISVIVNLSILGFFKYFGFFAESFAALLNVLGLQATFTTLHIVLPVGISFYTFQTLGYTIDVYRGKLEPSSRFVDFALFVSFFPQLVAGPIERASRLLPQIERPRTLSAAKVQAGLYLVLWGYVKKLVIADNLAPYVDAAFDPAKPIFGLPIIFGSMAFMWQIYGDFSGYTDIARGVAKLMGFDLMLNFKLPHFARNPREYWSRWHISLYSWLRDYLYIPLGGSRGGKISTYRNLLITMALGGLWHGASWHVVVWGLFHGIVLVLHRIVIDVFGSPTTKRKAAWLFDLFKITAMTLTLVAGFIVFRAASLTHALTLLSQLSLDNLSQSFPLLYDFAFYVGPLIVLQIIQAITKNLLIVLSLRPFWRVVCFAALLTWLIIFGARDTSQFIYFQF